MYHNMAAAKCRSRGYKPENKTRSRHGNIQPGMLMLGLGFTFFSPGVWPRHILVSSLVNMYVLFMWLATIFLHIMRKPKRCCQHTNHHMNSMFDMSEIIISRTFPTSSECTNPFENLMGRGVFSDVILQNTHKDWDIKTRTMATARF